MTFKQLCADLEIVIANTYQDGVTLETAERLAARFLHAQLQVSSELKNADLDSRMKKSGAKAVRAAAYLKIVQTVEKKPTEAQIAAMVDSDQLVRDEQSQFDTSEVDKEELSRYYDIFQNAHIYYRGIAKGRFE